MSVTSILRAVPSAEVRRRWLPWLLLAFEAVALAAIIVRVPYTEIDWTAYMQEVEGWAVGGRTDYLTLSGDTGPLVYPAGFLWLFRGLRAATLGGRGRVSLAVAQALFAAAYLATQATVLAVYGAAGDGCRWHTRVVPANGFNPVWRETAELAVGQPDAAFLYFAVFDQADVLRRTFLAYAAFPLSAVRAGFRACPLRSAHGKKLPFCSLLCRFEPR